ncbi:hypothetical protein COU54_04720 [Candidatus Pacearchaeota archaeon CG10_big_fil_rev_8_21_14_0_10_31_24]|nr:MAG: hypothetical protein COU54_04720 [Candidatus Pacearchaeota archaeon CG10_big_fil_rev_8_21_14_0_10_31_24]
MNLTNEEILAIVKEKGILLEREIFDLMVNFSDGLKVRDFLTTIERVSGQKMITKSILNKNTFYVLEAIKHLQGNNKDSAEKVCVKLGISLEISKEKDPSEEPKKRRMDYQIYYADTKATKKLEVADFKGHFRARYQQMQRILMARPELNGLVAINKISSTRQNLSIIGMVKDKRVTKNGNLILGVEDLTGEIKCLIKGDKREIFEIAEELQMDDVIAIKASGDRSILFVHDIFFPESHIPDKVHFSEDFSIAFLSDVHCGSNKHLKKGINNFLEWLNMDENAKKIRYIFFTGDNVDGVGIFPGQERVLELKSMKEQYDLLASYLERVPKHITMFMCPGQHDAVRVAEPQPLIDRKYAESLYKIENLVMVTNPTLVKFLDKDKEFKVLMYHGASIHGFIQNIPKLRIMKAHKTPAKVVKCMLQRRHLAPTHSSVVYIPNIDKDPLMIEQVPDVLCTGEVHRLDIDTHNGVLIITGSCWQAQTDFEEKVGNIPDPCKVPVLNLKTRELKIYDFGDEEEINREY